MVHNEMHRTHRIGWLRAAVLGANDGIVSTASLLIGVAAADSGHSAVMLAGVAGLFAGALSTPKRRILSLNASTSPTSRSLNFVSLQGSMKAAASTRNLHCRWPNSLWITTRSVPTLATNSGSPTR